MTKVKASKLRELRESMQFIFQDPFSSLNPRMTVQQTIMEPLDHLRTLLAERRG